METTFENFKRIFFDGLNPEDYSNQIQIFKNYLDKIHHDFYEVYTFCTGCKKIVRKDEAYSEKSTSLTFPNRSRIKCKKCHTTWYIRDDDDE